MGDSDLSPAADTAFRDSRMPRVRAYTEIACAPGLEDEASDATFVDFLARAPADPPDEQMLDRILLDATRSAAAGRFAVTVPMGRPELALSAECRAMPELLAAHANRERAADEALIAAHLGGCAVCAHTLEQMQRAERAYARAVGELPELEIEATTVDTTKAPRRAAPGRPAAPERGSRGGRPSESDPLPKPESGDGEAAGPEGAATSPVPPRPGPPAAPSGTRRRRTGGLAGAIRKLGRPGPA